MSVSEQLLEILVCPKCKGELIYTGSGVDNPSDGLTLVARPSEGLSTPDPKAESLICRACSLRYPVREDIPIMLIDEATPL